MSSSNQSFGASSSKDTLDRAPDAMPHDQGDSDAPYERYLEMERSFGVDIENVPGPSSEGATEVAHAEDYSGHTSYPHEAIHGDDAFHEFFPRDMERYGMMPSIADLPYGPPPPIGEFRVEAPLYGWVDDLYHPAQDEQEGLPQVETLEPWLDPALSSSFQPTPPSRRVIPSSPSPVDTLRAELSPVVAPGDQTAFSSPALRHTQPTSGPSNPRPAPSRFSPFPPSSEVFAQQRTASSPPKARPMSPVASTRIQPARSAKRKHEGKADVPDLIPADALNKSAGRRPKGARAAAPAAAAPTGMEPPRKRRKHAELEDIEMTEETRCGLEGCSKILRAPGLERARKHLSAHYEESTAPDALQTNAPEGSTGSAEKEGEVGERKYCCSYVGSDGKACSGKVYGSMLSLQRHIEGVHYGWGYKCPRCGRMFNRRDALLRHQKSGSACTAEDEKEGPAE